MEETSDTDDDEIPISDDYHDMIQSQAFNEMRGTNSAMNENVCQPVVPPSSIKIPKPHYHEDGDDVEAVATIQASEDSSATQSFRDIPWEMDQDTASTTKTDPTFHPQNPEVKPPKKRTTREETNAKRRADSKCPDLILKLNVKDRQRVLLEEERVGEGNSATVSRKARVLLVEPDNPDLAASGLKDVDPSVWPRLVGLQENESRRKIDLGDDKRTGGLRLEWWRKLCSRLAIGGLGNGSKQKIRIEIAKLKDRGDKLACNFLSGQFFFWRVYGVLRPFWGVLLFAMGAPIAGWCIGWRWLGWG